LTPSGTVRWKETFMSEISVESIAEEMFHFLEEASGKRNVSVNDLAKAMQAKLGPACTRDDCKKAVRILIESGKCVYCFQGGVNYIQVPKKEAANAN
jgi:hypothetical protein